GRGTAGGGSTTCPFRGARCREQRRAPADRYGGDDGGRPGGCTGRRRRLHRAAGCEGRKPGRAREGRRQVKAAQAREPEPRCGGPVNHHACSTCQGQSTVGGGTSHGDVKRSSAAGALNYDVRRHAAMSSSVTTTC